MKHNIKILALILAIVMLLSSCDLIPAQLFGETDTQSESASGEIITERKPNPQEDDDDGDDENEETNEETSTEAQSTTAKETEPATEASTYRQSISRSRQEVESMLTISDEDFTEAESLLVQFEEMALEGSDIDAINEIYDAFDAAYEYIATQISVASIIYYLDMSDEAAYDRYYGYYDKYGDMYNSYMAHCKTVYEQSPVRDELFADWTEDEIRQLLNFSPETTELTLRNDELTDELNNLSPSEFTDRSAEIYAEIVTNNNKLAKLYGYDNYYDYASKEIYGRDFGAAELESFCNTVAERYITRFDELYNTVVDDLGKLNRGDQNTFNRFLYNPFDETSTNYLVDYINSLDGSMKEGMEHVFTNRNMIFSYSPNSHPTAFQTYLDDFEMPFCLFGYEGQSASTMVHEIGHYYASLHNSTLISYDLAEVQSQGNEMLLLDYMKGCTSPTLHNALEGYYMYSYMATIIASSIIDEFEREVYALDSVEGYGSAEFDAIMTNVCEKYGGAAFVSNTLGDMNEYWRQVATNNPVYYISYAVSAVSALNIYAELSSDRDAGREMYRAVVEDVLEDDTFLTAITRAGISSPFDAETTEKIIELVWGK